MNLFDIINVPLGWIMRVCYLLVNNYSIALLLFAVIMQVLLLPFSIKQQKNSVRQAQLAPKIAALRKKYAGRTDAATQQKMQEETMELYKRENFNPASGCLPLLIQMPILLSLYNVVMNPLRYITGISAEKISELQTYITNDLAHELAARAPYIDMLNIIREAPADFEHIVPGITDMILPSLKMFGVDLSRVPTLSFSPFDVLLLIPVLTFVIALASQKITRLFTYQSPETIEAQKSPSMRIMNISMPLLSVWIAFEVPAAIGLYWMFRNIISTLQQILLSKLIPTPKYSEEEYRAAEREMKVKPVKEKKKNAIPPRSLHYIDDEEYQARLEAAKARLAAEEAELPEDAPVLKEDDRPTAEAPAAAANEAEDAKTPADGPADGEEKPAEAPAPRKVTPSAGQKYAKTGKNYKK
ncbi:MAG: YidC/Oxa1 family membrane protein insertase [Oscillospiraceae bacterium]|nr:YidC/Oxa1 family membrane protein insertase [Oscillospiraceae bacterium]